ncbi:hypothetical protein Tco_0134783 [Tanacetum coccineum]
MEELRSRQFRENKIKVMHAMVLGGMLQLYGLIELGELTQQVKKRLFAAIIVKRKATWQDCTKPKNPRTSAWFEEKEIPTLVAFQTDDLDAFDSGCDEAPSASVVLMAKLSSYDPVILLEAKDDKYLEEIIELEKKKKALDNVVYKMGQSTQIMHMLTKPQAFYDESHKTALVFVIDTEETLELAKESRLKMHAKQNDPIAKEKKVNTAPIDYVALNKFYEHFMKHFVP